MKRKMYADGELYPKKCQECESLIESFNEKLDHALGDNQLPPFTPRAVIVPHAGMLYSGFTANFTYRLLQEKSEGKKRIIVIGPSQQKKFSGISGGFYKSYKTPCGKLKIDLAYLEVLKNSFGIGFEKKAHKEASTEAQMPFIKYYLGDLKVIELVYGDVMQGEMERLIEGCLQDPKNIVVICTNLGDLKAQKELGIMDATYLNAITMLKNDKLHSGCNASGLIAIRALIATSQKQGLKPQILNYQTSSINTTQNVKVEGHLSVAMY